ncbi:MAG: PAS domain-containing sensor histidine kinase [Rhodobacteraceae bacterium]|nr:PAS domain-containing sensor histidine kinase [Paracoccaceae bacterium]
MTRNFELIWASLPSPAFVISADGMIVEANVAAEVFTESSLRHMQKRPLDAFTGAGSALIDVVRQAQLGMNSVILHDVEIGWGKQSRGVANVQATRLLNDADEVLLVLHPRGIADKMDRSLSHRNAARSVTGMAAMLAHEIRNPLAGISGAAQLLAMNLPPEDKEMTELILDETKRIGELVNRVEMFGDLRPLSPSGVNIHDILSRGKRAAQAGFASHMQFKEIYDPSIPLVSGDPDQLMQVVQNLLKNAAEASPNGGTITLKTAFSPGVKLSMPGKRSESLPIVMTIADNGPGIPDSLKNDIFDPFVSSKANGSGLGLSLVSKIIVDHGGIVECKSSENGASFQIMLPVWHESEE